MPEQLDIASRTVDGAFFLLASPAGDFSARALDETFDGTPTEGAQRSSDSLVWTRRNERSTLKGALLAMIRGAKHKVFIASFRIGDDELFVTEKLA